jgi:FtsZ-interacting cell division protein ZipA
MIPHDIIIGGNIYFFSINIVIKHIISLLMYIITRLCLLISWLPVGLVVWLFACLVCWMVCCMFGTADAKAAFKDHEKSSRHAMDT